MVSTTTDNLPESRVRSTKYPTEFWVPTNYPRSSQLLVLWSDVSVDDGHLKLNQSCPFVTQGTEWNDCPRTELIVEGPAVSPLVRPWVVPIAHKLPFSRTKDLWCTKSVLNPLTLIVSFLSPGVVVWIFL